MVNAKSRLSGPVKLLGGAQSVAVARRERVRPLTADASLLRHVGSLCCRHEYSNLLRK